MHAIIRQGNGKYYVSAVFGYYNNVKSEDDYQRYLERIYSPYYIVWDENRQKLVKVYEMEQGTKYMITQVLVVDESTDGWVVDEEGIGGVDFLTRELVDEIVESGNTPADIIEKCKAVDEGYCYEEYKEIKTEQDINNLQCAAGWFHDAFISEEKLLDDGTLYILLDGVWGCKVEVWFSGDVEYDISSRNPDEYDPYWYGSTILMQDGYIYFVDEDDMTVDEIGKGYCWFKARHMKYHIIPN